MEFWVIFGQYSFIISKLRGYGGRVILNENQNLLHKSIQKFFSAVLLPIIITDSFYNPGVIVVFSRSYDSLSALFSTAKRQLTTDSRFCLILEQLCIYFSFVIEAILNSITVVWLVKKWQNIEYHQICVVYWNCMA